MSDHLTPATRSVVPESATTGSSAHHLSEILNARSRVWSSLIEPLKNVIGVY